MKYLIVIAAIALTSCLVWLFYNPPLTIPVRDESVVIRKKLIAFLPLGTSSSMTAIWLSEHSYKFTNQNTGFLQQENGHSKVIGTHSIRCFLGETRKKLIFTQSVTAFFGFDDQDKLVDVWIWKTTDAF